MFRFYIVFCLWLLGVCDAARGESLAERGGYLVNTIMACGNCHSPRDANGQLVKEREFSGGLAFNTPAFTATAPNITPDRETGIGSWSDAEIKHALVEGMRPNHGRLAGVPLAAIMPANFYKALLPNDLDAIVAYLRTVRPVRNEVAVPVYKAPVRRDPYPDAEAGFSKAVFADPAKRGAFSSPSAIAWNAIRLGRRAFPISGPDWARAAGCSRRAKGHRRERHRAPPPTSRRTLLPASAPGPIRKSGARSRMALAAMGGRSSRRWPMLIMWG
jgi:hypothetical protein